MAGLISVAQLGLSEGRDMMYLSWAMVLSSAVVVSIEGLARTMKMPSLNMAQRSDSGDDF
jgi:hypothetical protein